MKNPKHPQDQTVIINRLEIQVRKGYLEFWRDRLHAFIQDQQRVAILLYRNMNYLHLLHSVFMKLTSFGPIGDKISSIMWSYVRITWRVCLSGIRLRIVLFIQNYLDCYAKCIFAFIVLILVIYSKPIYSLKYWSIFFSLIFIEFNSADRTTRNLELFEFFIWGYGSRFPHCNWSRASYLLSLSLFNFYRTALRNTSSILRNIFSIILRNYMT